MTPQQSTNFLDLPDIRPDIYRASSALDAVKKHIETLEKEIAEHPGNMNAMLLKNSFEQYHYYISNLAKKNRQAFNSIHQHTVKQHPTLNIKTTARKKSVISYYNKARRNLADGRSLDIPDIYACRTIIDDTSISPEELLKLCYTIMDENITYMVSLGYTPSAASEPKDTKNFDRANFPDIFIPERSYIDPMKKKYIRDYIFSPKADSGYQSLHALFIDKSGRHFEYQVRTQLMDHHAEYGIANHQVFKEKQLQSRNIPALEIDRSKVHMSFYTYMYGELSDDAGLEKSSSCLLRTHNV